MGEIIRNAVRVLKEKHLEIDYLSDFLNLEATRNSYRDDHYWKHFDDKDKKGWYVFREKRESAQRVGSRLSAFILDEDLKKFTIGPNQFDVAEIAANKKIVCFNLHGLDNDLMLYIGNLVTTSVKAYYNHLKLSGDNPPLFLYVDEFQNFLSPAFHNMLAECAKFNISVNLAHQTIRQTSEKTLNIVLGNAYTKVIFNCGGEEAKRFANEFQVKESEFLNLDKYKTVVKIGTKIFHIETPPPPDIQPYQPKPPVYFLRDEWIKVPMV